VSQLLRNAVCVVNLVLLEVSVVLKHVVLELDVSFYLADVALCIALGLLLVLVNLSFEVLLNALL
jgi:hypothetical protein